MSTMTKEQMNSARREIEGAMKMELKTRKELRAEMEECCRMMEKCGFENCTIVYHGGLESLQIRHSVNDVSNGNFLICGKPVAYKVLNPPAKFRAVYYKNPHESTVPGLKFIVGVSMGEFDFNGKLMLMGESQAWCRSTDTWCDCLDKSHRSENWNSDVKE